MLAYVARRLAVGCLLLLVLSVITFTIYLKVPADPAEFLIRTQGASPAALAHAHHALGTDKPAYVQYLHFISRVLHGNFGISWQSARFAADQTTGASVGPMVLRGIIVTGFLTAGGLVLLLLIAIPLGAFVATRPNSLADRLSIAASAAAISTHPLVVGLMLQLFVGYRWKLAPPSGYCTLSPPSASTVAHARLFGPTGAPLPCGGIVPWASHLLLPWVTFALFFVALYLRIIRVRMIETLEEPWIRTARAKGASELRVLRVHALRSALAPVVSMVAMDAGMAIGIAMYIETVFGLPGLGRLMIRALSGLQGYDLPVILAVTLVAGAAIILLNLLADLALLGLDPRAAQTGRPVRLLRRAAS
jgi:peptide/nickel transport system permease protein